MRIALTGSTGLIGSRLTELLKNDVEFIPFLQSELDITSKKAVEEKVKKTDFDLFLHLAAYTNVDGAEKEIDTARNINVTGTQNLFEATQEKGKQFIYISTDFVFDGTNPPYTEDSTPNPISAYGQTKYEGEVVVKDKAMIVRLAYPYRAQFEKKRDFVRTLKFLLEQGKQLTMVTDSTFTPTFIDDLVFSLKHLVTHFSPETYHIIGGSTLSPFESGKLIAKTFGLDETLVNPTTYDAYFNGKAKRPQFSEVISKKNDFYRMKTFEEGMEEMKKQLL